MGFYVVVVAPDGKAVRLLSETLHETQQDAHADLERLATSGEIPEGWRALVADTDLSQLVVMLPVEVPVEVVAEEPESAAVATPVEQPVLPEEATGQDEVPAVWLEPEAETAGVIEDAPVEEAALVAEETAPVEPAPAWPWDKATRSPAESPSELPSESASESRVMAPAEEPAPTEVETPAEPMSDWEELPPAAIEELADARASVAEVIEEPVAVAAEEPASIEAEATAELTEEWPAPPQIDEVEVAVAEARELVTDVPAAEEEPAEAAVYEAETLTEEAEGPSESWVDEETLGGPWGEVAEGEVAEGAAEVGAVSLAEEPSGPSEPMSVVEAPAMPGWESAAEVDTEAASEVATAVPTDAETDVGAETIAEEAATASDALAEPEAPAQAYEPGASDIAELTCDDCVYVNTCPKHHDTTPSECGSFQWRS